MKNKNTNKNVSVINKYNILPVMLQFIFTILLIIFGILYFVNGDYNKWFLLFLGLDLMVMGYNNNIIYRRKNFTFLYVVFGIIVLFISLLFFLGVNI